MRRLVAIAALFCAGIALAQLAPSAQGKVLKLGIVDAGQLPAPVQGGLVYDAIYQAPLVSDGGTWSIVQGASSAASGWTTALDCVLMNEATTNFSGNTEGATATLCGKTWYLIDAARSNATPGTVNDAGLNITPTSNATWATSADAPKIAVKMTDLLPTYRADMPLRISTWSTANYTANYDGALEGFYWGAIPAGNRNWMMGGRAFSTSCCVDVLTMNTGGVQEFYASPVGGPFGGYNFRQTTLPNGMGGADAYATGADYDGGVPSDVANTAVAIVNKMSFPAGSNWMGTTMALSNVYAALSAVRNSSGTTFTATFRRVKIEYVP